MKKPPAYIPIIMDDHIRLEGDLSELTDEVIRLKKMSSGHQGISFDSSIKSHFENVDLISKLLELNEIGILFGEDCKQLYSPAAFMRELQIKGMLRVDFQSIFWKGPDNWSTKVNKVEPGS